MPQSVMRKLSTYALQSCNNARMNDWDDCRYFLAVARAGNVTAASGQLAVNHSTVSRRITAMEKKHGVRLFERLANGYEMTAAAEGIYPIALEIEKKNLQMERLLFAQDSRLQGTLNITLPHDLANYCVLPHFKQFTETNPNIDVNFIVSPGLKDLNAREADIAVRLSPSPPDYLIGKKVAELRHGIYQSKRYKPTQQQRPQVILWTFEKGLPMWVHQHYPNAEVALRVDDLASMYAAVKAGYGLARIPCYLPDIMKDKLVYRHDLALTHSNWGLWILSHVDLRETQRVKTCKQFLTSCLTAQKDLFEGLLSTYKH